MASKGGRHYVIIPTLIDIEANSQYVAASTSVYCPYKVLPDHNGFAEVTTVDNNTIGQTAFFKEIVGVVPTKVRYYHSGTSTQLTDSNLSTYINKIRYNYLVDGHKVITIVYNQNAFNDTFQEIEFKILFDDGEFHTVSQPIVHSMCLDSDTGVVIDYTNLFNYTASPTQVINPSDRSSESMGNLVVTNADNSKVISFNTYAYTDPKFYSNPVNRNYFMLAYGKTFWGDEGGTTLGQNFTMSSNGLNFPFSNDGIMWEFRQSSRSSYKYNHAHNPGGLERGTIGKEINPLGDISFEPLTNPNDDGNHANNGYKSVNFLNTVLPQRISANGLWTSATGMDGFSPSPQGMEDASNDTNIPSNVFGFAGSFPNCNAFYQLNSGSHRKNNDTSRKFDGIIYAVSNSAGGSFSTSGTAVDDGYDFVYPTPEDTGEIPVLKTIASALMIAADAEGLNGGVSLNSIGTWGQPDINIADRIGTYLLFDEVAPQDVISNFILGNHTYFLGRPHDAANTNDQQSLYQSSLTAAVFMKANHPSWVAANTLAIPTTEGLAVSKTGLENSTLIKAIPYHYYVDSYQSIKYSGAAIGPTLTLWNSSLSPWIIPSGDSEDPLANTDMSIPTILSTSTPLSVQEISIKSNGVTYASFHEVYDNSGVGFPPWYYTTSARPSLDKNSVQYSQNPITEPAYTSNGNSSFLDSSNTTPYATNVADNLFTTNVSTSAEYFSGTHNTTLALIAQSGLSTSYDGDTRKVYTRGCVNMVRGRDVASSNFELDLLTTPAISNAEQAVTEVQFNVKYNVRGENVVTDTLFPLLVNATNVDCGCGNSPSNIQWKESGGANFDVANALDIFRVKYTPGRNIVDNSLFPINETDFSPGTIVSEEDLDTRKLTINLDDHLPTELDRPLIDVELDNFSWDEDSIHISTIQIAGRSTGIVTQLGTLAADSSVDDLNFSPQTFQFVALGAQVIEGGGVADDILGCTNPASLNYNPLATADDGTCIDCDLSNTQSGFATIDTMLSNLTIGPQNAITAASQSFGMSNWYNNPNYLYGVWHAGQIGNAHNAWGPGLTAAGANPAVPYGPAFGEDASPYTEFSFNFDFSASATPSDPDFANFIQELINQNSFGLDAWTLGFYDIDQWTGDELSDWGQLYDVSADAVITIPIIDYVNNQGIGTMANQGTVNAPKFASWGQTWTGYGGQVGGGFLPNHVNFLQDPYIQTYLQPGKHYVAVLNLSVAAMTSGYKDPDTGNSILCRKNIAIPFNFWVTFCGCDVFDAENYVGALFDFPWSNAGSNNTPFPAGYSQMTEECQNATGSRKIKLNDTDASGFCIVPDPFSCDSFIDLCVQSTTPNCIPAPTPENPANQDFSGTISVSVYGAATNFENDAYAFVILNELFLFDLYLFDGEYTGDLSTAVNSYSFTSLQDYLDVGFNPNNDNHLLLNFTDLPQGSYTVVLVQTNTFAFQEAPCDAVVLDLATLALEGGEDCPELAVGCMDNTATNYDPLAVVPCDNCCEYLICEDVFLTGKITSVTTTNTVINCVSTDLGTDPATFVNTLVDSNIGTFTIPGDGYDITGLADSVTGTFVVGYCQVFGGNVGSAVTNILDVFTNQNALVLNTARTETITISNFGGILPFDNLGNPVLTSDGYIDTGLSTGYYVVMIIPGYVDVLGDDCTTEIIDNFDGLSFFTIASTLNFDGCPTPCNDQTNPEDCPDWVPGCTDENATNYDPNADYDDGTCNNGGQEECVENPGAPGCEDCDTAEATGLPGYRNCDEFDDSTEGCCDPLACNFNPTVDVCLQSICEYCCDGSEDCEDGPTTDECEDENGNILPDCVQAECPDPTNPDCDVPPVNPCPTGDCGGPPEAECVILGNCPEGPGDGDDDDDIIIEDEIITEVTCQPALGNYSTFDEVRTAAMTCSANEGSKLLFKLRSGVKYDKTDLIKLTLINYLFNNAINESCMSSCKDVISEKARQLGINRPSCKDRWTAGGAEIWTPTSTYGKGAVVGVLKLESGKTRLSYYVAVAPVGSGDPHPTAKLSKSTAAKWGPCTTVRGKNFDVPGQEPYVHKLYEFMAKFCEQCNVYSVSLDPTDGLGGGTARIPKKDAKTSGIVDENGNEIKLF